MVIGFRERESTGEADKCKLEAKDRSNVPEGMYMNRNPVNERV